MPIAVRPFIGTRLDVNVGVHEHGLASNKGVRIIDFDRNAEFCLPNRQPGTPSTIALFPKCTTAAVGYEDGTLACWNLQTRKHWTDERDGIILSLAYDSSGSRLATGSGDFDTAIRIYRVEDGEVTGENLCGHKDSVLSLVFSPVKRDLLISASFDNTILVWDLRTRESVKELRAHTASVHHLLLTSDGKTLISAGGDRAIRIWDTRTWQQRAILRGHSRAVFCLAWARNESILVSGDADGSVRFWRALRAE